MTERSDGRRSVQITTNLAPHHYDLFMEQQVEPRGLSVSGALLRAATTMMLVDDLQQQQLAEDGDGWLALAPASEPDKPFHLLDPLS